MSTSKTLMLVAIGPTPNTGKSFSEGRTQREGGGTSAMVILLSRSSVLN